MPSERLRQLEVEANCAFDQYREMYFEGGVSSVYLWDLEVNLGFAGMIIGFRNLFKTPIVPAKGNYLSV